MPVLDRLRLDGRVALVARSRDDLEEAAAGGLRDGGGRLRGRWHQHGLRPS
jgi:hypothetical protein